MLIRFSEQIINRFLIPSFTLDEGEIVIIRLPNEAIFYDLTVKISQLLTGEVISDDVKIAAHFKFAEHFKESAFRHHFMPATIGRYHQRYANQNNPVYRKVYDTDWVTPQIKVNTLAGKLRKQLSLYTALSWTSNVIFDLVGVDPEGCEDIYNFVKTIVISGGAAVLFDYTGNFENNCTTFVQAKYLGSVL